MATHRPLVRRRSLTPQRIESQKRARRAERRSLAGKIALGVAVVLAIGAAAYGMSLLPEQPKNVHWHPTWEVYVNDQNVAWTGRDFDMAEMGSGMHFHQPNDNVIHAEGRSDRLSLGSLMLRVGGELTDSLLRIPPPATQAGDYAENESAPLRVFYKPAGEDWRELESDFADLRATENMRILITYAPSSDEAIETQKASVSGPPDDPTAPMREATNATTQDPSPSLRGPGPTT